MEPVQPVGVSVDYYVRMERGNLVGAYGRHVIPATNHLVRAHYAPVPADPRRPAHRTGHTQHHPATLKTGAVRDIPVPRAFQDLLLAGFGFGIDTKRPSSSDESLCGCSGVCAKERNDAERVLSGLVGGFHRCG